MSITAIDRHTALLVIDLQKGIVAYPTVHPVESVLAHASELARAFRRHGLPVVLVNVEGGAPGRTEQPRRGGERPADWSELVSELDQQPDDIVLSKRSWGAFTHTSLESRLRKLGVTQLVIAGIATSIGVESSARQAYELGFNVSLALDAMTDMSTQAHENSVQRIFPRLGETGTSAEIVAMLDRRES